MHFALTTALAGERRRDLVEAAARQRKAPSRRERLGSISIREATPDDGSALARLLELDSIEAALAPNARWLLAETNGRLAAALPLDGGSPAADPFEPTEELVALLEMRARQLTGGRFRRRRRLLFA